MCFTNNRNMWLDFLIIAVFSVFLSALDQANEEIYKYKHHETTGESEYLISLDNKEEIPFEFSKSTSDLQALSAFENLNWEKFSPNWDGQIYLIGHYDKQTTLFSLKHWFLPAPYLTAYMVNNYPPLCEDVGYGFTKSDFKVEVIKPGRFNHYHNEDSIYLHNAKVIASHINCDNTKNTQTSDIVYITTEGIRFIRFQGKGETEKERSSSCYLQETEVTQELWTKIMKDEPWKGKPYVQVGPNFPAVFVSWVDAQNFIKRLNQLHVNEKYRLPTIEEWEYAASPPVFLDRGDQRKSVQPFTEMIPLEYGWFFQNTMAVGQRYAHMVKQKSPNRSGFYDLYGNVWEWCEDGDSNTCPDAEKMKSRKQVRGCSWLSARMDPIQDFPAQYRSLHVGLRLILEKKK
jgi:hypothetical protein